MSKYTPGPWNYIRITCEDGFRPDRYSIGAESLPGENKHIASVSVANGWSDVDGKSHHQELPGEANATLIAASPDLLEALKSLAYYVKDHNLALYQEAMDAINKAEGK